MVSNSLVQGYILVMFILANLPFLNQRMFLLIPVTAPGSRKSFWIQMVEWFVLYAIAIGIGLYLENSIGGIQHKPWEFWVVTLFMFATLAAPGFIWQYQLSRHLWPSR